MKIARIGPPGAERPVVLAPDETLRDLRGVTTDIDAAFLEHVLPSLDVEALPLVAGEDRFGCPIGKPGKIVGIGLNYASYAASLGVVKPSAPVVFLIASSSITGPTDPITPLPQATTTDYEAELGVVLGRRLCGEVSADAAMAAVAGYVLVNDVTDRERVAGSPGPWASGKCADTYTPVGPWLVTPDELGDPADVRLTLHVDGQLLQDERVSGMVFDVPSLLVHLASVMALEPGDLICTGTPTGTAATRPEPRPYLRSGQLVMIDGGVLGHHRSRIA